MAHAISVTLQVNAINAILIIPALAVQVTIYWKTISVSFSVTSLTVKAAVPQTPPSVNPAT
jgi:hypothetical protein